jgi:hypothetical protein
MKLKEIVEIAIEKGFKYKGGKILCVDPIYNAVKELQYIGLNIDMNGTGDMTQRNWVNVSLSDILFNQEFMKAVFGTEGCKNIEHKPCPISGATKYITAAKFCNKELCGWGKRYIAGSINVMLEAAKLPTDEERINYVYNLIKGDVK